MKKNTPVEQPGFPFSEEFPVCVISDIMSYNFQDQNQEIHTSHTGKEQTEIF